MNEESTHILGLHDHGVRKKFNEPLKKSTNDAKSIC